MDRLQWPGEHPSRRLRREVLGLRRLRAEARRQRQEQSQPGAAPTSDLNWPALRPRHICLQVVCLLLVAGIGDSARPAPSPAGQWTVSNGQANIRVVDCGGKYWGFVASEQKPGGSDKNNPNPALRQRPI